MDADTETFEGDRPYQRSSPERQSGIPTKNLSAFIRVHPLLTCLPGEMLPAMRAAFLKMIPKRCALLVLVVVSRLAADPAANPLLDRWLGATTNLVTWQATVTQTRHLKALTQPLVSTGQVWFAAPNSFRWELGVPPQSIALRSGHELTLLSPRLRRAEKHVLGNAAGGPVNDMMGLLDAGFPRDAAEFKKRFELVDVVTNETALVLRMRPQNATARRMMPSVVVELAPLEFQLRATVLTFADGSRLRNAFSDAITNAPLSPEMFRTNLDSTWKVTTGGGAR
jgi:outer membrane lipoprotein-sorting protein